MAVALSLGRRGQGRTWPNPAVGCVIVNDGHIVGRGWTADGGRPHAEPQALAQAGHLARGATAYVTLEPCSHFGKTPPCAQALIDAGISHVVAAVQDRDPRVNGAGFDMLRSAGIRVTTGVLADQAAQDHAGFFKVQTDARPWVTLKLATSFDGRIATAGGDSQWITDAPARRAVHAMRARYDAVMIGAGTARDDDPTLNIRDLGIERHPLRVVVSRSLDIPLASNLARTAADIPLWLCHGAEAQDDGIIAWRGVGAQTIMCATQRGTLDPVDVVHQLAKRGVTRVFCEGGGSLAASLLHDDLVDEVIGFQAGVIIGAEGRPSIGALGIDVLRSAPRFALYETQHIGPDVMTIWRRKQ
jgi:diaminohydroxyphosphoribosylaminopyrimidine deaminase/5-amino-6-(5-phosphoribosylamino)uracil reductase